RDVLRASLGRPLPASRWPSPSPALSLPSLRHCPLTRGAAFANRWPLLRAMKTGLDVSRESSYDSNPNQRSLNMHEPNEDVAGYIAARVLGEDSETPPQQPLHTMSLRLPYEMAAYLIEL